MHSLSCTINVICKVIMQSVNNALNISCRFISKIKNYSSFKLLHNSTWQATMLPVVYSSSSDYIAVQVLLPSIVLLVLLFFFLFLTTITCFFRRKLRDSWYDNVATPCVKKVFGDILKVYESENEEKVYVVFKCYKSPQFYINWLFLILLNLAGNSDCCSSMVTVERS